MDTVSIRELKGILLPFFSLIDCKLLLKNKVIVSEIVGNKTYVFNNSIQKFQKQLNNSDYYTTKECNTILSENGFVVDKIFYEGSPSSYFNFPISLKSLYERGYFKKDVFVSKNILKKSFDKGIIQLINDYKNTYRTQMIRNELKNILKSKINQWELEILNNKVKKIEFTRKSKPQLTKVDIENTIIKIDEILNPIQMDNKPLKLVFQYKKKNSPKKGFKGIKTLGKKR